ncbi:MAG: 4-hydroxy-tetrahydrodipicolinate reductase [Bacteroidales bacterium]|nr:4-hydroxy-tetrahydrodipicolinate reductase [Bacteroidales bacterium]
MEIALLGYGKMGKEIAAVAEKRGHEISATIDSEADWMEKIDDLRHCDVAIDFSTPDTAVDNIMKCFNIGMPIVVGTTGWYDQLESVVHDCRQRGDAALFVASNFSLGVNILFDINRRLADIMNRYPQYDVRIGETHHIHKLDAPSGTAITLANDILDRIDRKEEWKLNATHPGELDITAYREGEVSGIHEVTYDSDVDTLSIRHEAKSRKGFALGAVLAAEFLDGKRGYFTMSDLLK